MSNEKQLSPIEQLKPTETSLMNLVLTYRDRMMKRASESLQHANKEKQDQFLARTVASIIKNEGLAECFNSNEGKVSIYMLIDDCLKTGLELDKHAYAIPYGKKIKTKTGEIWIKTANFQIKRQGFHALLCGGDKPIFKNLLSGIVYEKEKENIKINRATGEVDHPICIDSDRGKPIGAWVQCVHLDNRKEAEYYPIKFVYDIRNNHSRTYQEYLAKKINTCTWITDEIPMIEKTAIKAFCRPYADIHEALASAYYTEGDEIIEQHKNIEEIADIVLDKTMENLDNIVEDKPVPETENKPEEKDEKVLF